VGVGVDVGVGVGVGVNVDVIVAVGVADFGANTSIGLPSAEHPATTTRIIKATSMRTSLQVFIT
jgi:hypothetical protein